MALDTTPITPVNDPNSLDASNAASKVYPPLPGTTTTANDIGAAEQILRNQTHTLNETKLSKSVADSAAGIITFAAGAIIAAAQTLEFAGAFIDGTVKFLARKGLWRTRSTVADSTPQTLSAVTADRFYLPANNAAPIVITLASSGGNTPLANETMTFFWNPAGAGGAGTQYTFQREDTTVVATFVGSAAVNTGVVYAEFEFAGGVWRLGTHSGTPYDGVGSYGVIAGAGA